uniref:Candidate secreted effector n=1 Tax=Meloidogyne incognita TaxID=6306 RepID=A0A914LEI3_MELIC
MSTQSNCLAPNIFLHNVAISIPAAAKMYFICCSISSFSFICCCTDYEEFLLSFVTPEEGGLD